MPGQSAHSIKKSKVSRVSKIRKEGNQKIADSALRGDLEEAEFGRVLKHLGDSRVRILTSERKECTAVIRGLLRRRGCTPINTDSLVVLSQREYESRKEPIYDIMAVLSMREADKLKKMGIIPEWMILGASDIYTGSHDERAAFEFDHAGDEEDNVDVDTI